MAPAAASPTRYVALLRGVYVAGVRVPMATLVELCEQLGWTEVRTYANSGNVRLDAGLEADAVVDLLESALEAEFGRVLRVVLRTQAQLADAAARCEANRRATDGPKALHVGFCNALPDAGALAEADWNRVAPDTAVVSGSELLLRYPDGMGRSKMTPQWLVRHIGRDLVLTVRSVGMVRTLSEL